MADERDAQISGDDAGGAAILYETARWRLDEQLERVRSLDNKLAATFTLNAAVVALFGAAMALTDRSFPHHVWALAVVVFSVFVVNLAFAYRAYRQKEWSVRPNLQRLDTLMDQEAASVVQRWVARELIASVDHNEALLLQKTADARAAFATTVLDAGPGRCHRDCRDSAVRIAAVHKVRSQRPFVTSTSGPGGGSSGRGLRGSFAAVVGFGPDFVSAIPAPPPILALLTAP